MFDSSSTEVTEEDEIILPDESKTSARWYQKNRISPISPQVQKNIALVRKSDDEIYGSHTTAKQRQRPNLLSRLRASSRWYRIHGVAEVTESHLLFGTVTALRFGIGTCLQMPPNGETSVECRVLSETSFTVTSHFPILFKQIRDSLCIKEDEFLLQMSKKPYLEFISNSKSGQDFFISESREYFIKTDDCRGVSLFRNLISNYMEHMTEHPHSLIVKYIGLYTLQFGSESPKHFFVMQSIFFPGSQLQHRFDLKGCYAGRYQKPPKEGEFCVLKDRNLRDGKFCISLKPDDVEWLRVQLKADIGFMQSNGLLDYSILLGFEPKNAALDYQATSIAKIVGQMVSSGFSRATSGVRRSDTRITSGSGDNRRLLLAGRNTLHIFEGADTRYYIGIIDFFTQYRFRQKFGQIFKTLRHLSFNHSTINPKKYGDRQYAFFLEYLREVAAEKR